MLAQTLGPPSGRLRLDFIPAVALKTQRCLGLFSCGALGFVSRGDKTKRVWFWGGQNQTKPDRLVLQAPMVSKKQTKRAFGFAAQPLYFARRFLSHFSIWGVNSWIAAPAAGPRGDLQPTFITKVSL